MGYNSRKSVTQKSNTTKVATGTLVVLKERENPLSSLAGILHKSSKIKA